MDIMLCGTSQADHLRRHWACGTARYARCEASDRRFELVSKDTWQAVGRLDASTESFLLVSGESFG